ncbi:MAG: tryptophan--tRNA ligase [Acidimicrobiales bacterium]
MARVFSGIQPTGDLQLGNYLAAIRRWVRAQHDDDAIHCIVDLHALTIPQDPAELRARTISTTQILVAAGLDPEVCTLFAQSQVPEHTELGWIMECSASFGELRRMTQFKEKSDRTEFVSAGLFTYPALMAADILLYDTDKVPVGDDQRQHIEITRDIALRFNHRYGDTFVVPEGAIAPIGARVMDLQAPERKMSKSVESPQGTVTVLDPPEAIERKFKRAVTDSEAEVRYDPAAKPGVSNLLVILAAATDGDPEALAESYSQYGPLKADAAEAVIALLEPLQKRYAELAADPGETARILAHGADKARRTAGATMVRVRDRLGLLPV